PAHYPCATVDQQPVDQATVTHLPEAMAQQASTLGNHVLVDPVDVVLVLENIDHAAERTTDGGTCLRTEQARVPGHHGTCHDQPERHGVEAMGGIFDPAVEVRGD